MTKTAKQVLLVDDEEKLLKSIAQRMTVLGFVPHTATSGMEALTIATQHAIDVAIVDLQMPDMDGLVTITKLKEIKPDLKTILLTGHGNEKVKQATESLNTVYFEKEEMGTFWQFVRGLSTDGNVVVIRPASSSDSQKGQRVGVVQSEIEIHSGRDFSETHIHKDAIPASVQTAGLRKQPRIIGETPAMQRLRNNLERMALLDCPVTLRGEPGTGRELAARVIHGASGRGHLRFLAINCSVFSNKQTAKQFLGHVAGSLYEAILSRSGIFGGDPVGTLLLDQIEALPDGLQVQLLHILDAANTKQYANTMNIRIMVSTATDLMQRVRAKSFRGDLYDRLSMFELVVPPLRERKDDIPTLCQYFFDHFQKEFGKAVDSVSPEVIDLLISYDFPGNVRELEYIMERAVTIADGSVIGREHLPPRFQKETKSQPSSDPMQFEPLAQMENRYILKVLDATNGNKSKTAEILGISRAALWRKLKQMNAE